MTLLTVWWYAIRSYAKAGQWSAVWLLVRRPHFMASICWHYLHGRGAWLEWRVFGAPLPASLWKGARR